MDDKKELVEPAKITVRMRDTTGPSFGDVDVDPSLSFEIEVVGEHFDFLASYAFYDGTGMFESRVVNRSSNRMAGWLDKEFGQAIEEFKCKYNQERREAREREQRLEKEVITLQEDLKVKEKELNKLKKYLR